MQKVVEINERGKCRDWVNGRGGRCPPPRRPPSLCRWVKVDPIQTKQPLLLETTWVASPSPRKVFQMPMPENVALEAAEALNRCYGGVDPDTKYRDCVYAHNDQCFGRAETWVFYGSSEDTPETRLKVDCLVSRLNAADWSVVNGPIWIGSGWGIEAPGPNNILGSMDRDLKPILAAIYAEAGLGSMLLPD